MTSPRTRTVAEAIRDATELLGARTDSARLDAELLMAEALGTSRSDLFLHHMREPEPAGFAALLARRAAHEPVAYIRGYQEFFGLDRFTLNEQGEQLRKYTALAGNPYRNDYQQQELERLGRELEAVSVNNLPAPVARDVS